MREIKFRAFRDGEMLYQEQSGTAYAAALFNRIYSQHLVMQYTGLKDKNGKEIYEGDILSHGDKLNLLVIFEDGCFSFDCRISKHTGISMTMKDHQESEFEVIGNQFETPELVPELL